MSCINKNTKEFKTLLGETQFSPNVLALKISMWQSANNTSMYPSAEQLTGLSKEVVDTFTSNREMLNIGTELDYYNYLKTTNTPTQEGFLDYQLNKVVVSDIVNANEAFTDISSVPSRVNLNTLYNAKEDTIAPFRLDNPKVVDKKFNDLFFRGQSLKKMTGQKLVDNLSESFSGHLSNTADTLISKLQRIPNLDKVKIIVDNDIDVLANYNSANKTISLNKEALIDKSTEQIIAVLLHETVHFKTVDALTNPSSEQEIELAEAVDNAFNVFKNDKDYGFTDKFEFVAEFYSNEVFRNKVKEAFEGLEEDRNWYQRLYDAVRRLLGMPKTSGYDQLFDTIARSVESESQEREVSSTGIFNMINDKTSNFDNSVKYLEYINNILKDNIDNHIKSLNKQKSNPNYTLDTREEIDNLVALFENIENSEQVENIVPLYKYMKQMAANLNVVKSSLAHHVVTHNQNVNSLDLVYQLETMLTNYDIIEDISGYIETVRKEYQNFLKAQDQNDTGETYKFSESDIDNLTGVLKNVADIKDEIESTLYKEKQKIASELINNPVFNTRVEKMYKDQFTKEYGSGIAHNETKDQYIARRFSETTDERQNTLDELAMEYVYNPSEDMSATDLKLSDLLNINTDLVRIATNMIFDHKEKIHKILRGESLVFKSLHNDYAKTHSSNDTAKKYAKLLVEDSKGKRFVINQYNIKMLDNYNEMREKINVELYGSNKAFPISGNEHRQIREIGSDKLFRNESVSDVAIGDNINLQANEKFSSINANVSKITTFDKSDMSKRDEVVRKYTRFDNYAQLEASKEYQLSTSRGSQRNPELFKYLKGENDLVVYDYTRHKEASHYTTTEAYKDWVKEHFNVIENQANNEFTYLVKDKYKNKDYDLLTPEEKIVAERFNMIGAQGTSIYGKFNSLASSFEVSNASFTALPMMNKSDLERRLTGDFRGMFKDFKGSLKGTRQEDFATGEPLDKDGNPLYGLRVHQRGYIKPEDQSLELFDLFFNEYEHMMKFSERRTFEKKMKIVTDISKGKEYIQRSKKTGGVALNSKRGRQPIQTIDGSTSNEYQKLMGMMETAIYDIYTYHGGMLGNFEVNKLAGLVNGFAASVALTANVPTGIANIVNGRAQLQMDAIGKYHYNTKDLLSAEKNYFAELGNSIADLRNPIKSAKVNLMLEMFDFVGGVSYKKQSFLKDSMGKKILSTETSNAFNDMGEHYMSYVLTESILRGVKVLNKNHEFIDKNGTVVTTAKEAASVYDMLEYSKEKGDLSINPLAVYTTHTMTVPLDNGGLSHLKMLVKKKSHDMYGAYDSNIQPELQKVWWGKSLMMFKRFLIPGLQYRYRNYSNIMKHPDEVADDSKIYNSALKEYEEGYYVTFGRMIINSMRSLKSEGLKYVPEYYNNLSDYEKANIRKAITEITMRGILLPALAMLLMAGWDDDEKPYWLIYQVVRLSSELGQFSNPLDMTKILTNPVAGMNSVQNTLRLATDILFFINIDPKDDEYVFDWLNEDAQGNNKMVKNMLRLTPVGAQVNKEYSALINNLQR